MPSVFSIRMPSFIDASNFEDWYSHAVSSETVTFRLQDAREIVRQLADLKRTLYERNIPLLAVTMGVVDYYSVRENGSFSYLDGGRGVMVYDDVTIYMDPVRDHGTYPIFDEESALKVYAMRRRLPSE